MQPLRGTLGQKINKKIKIIPVGLDILLKEHCSLVLSWSPSNVSRHTGVRVVRDTFFYMECILISFVLEATDSSTVLHRTE